MSLRPRVEGLEPVRVELPRVGVGAHHAPGDRVACGGVQVHVDGVPVAIAGAREIPVGPRVLDHAGGPAVPRRVAVVRAVVEEEHHVRVVYHPPAQTEVLVTAPAGDDEALEGPGIRDPAPEVLDRVRGGEARLVGRLIEGEGDQQPGVGLLLAEGVHEEPVRALGQGGQEDELHGAVGLLQPAPERPEVFPDQGSRPREIPELAAPAVPGDADGHDEGNRALTSGGVGAHTFVSSFVNDRHTITYDANPTQGG